MRFLEKCWETLKSLSETHEDRQALIRNYLIEHRQESFTTRELMDNLRTGTNIDSKFKAWYFGADGIFDISLDDLAHDPQTHKKEWSRLTKSYTSADDTPFKVRTLSDTEISTFVFLLDNEYVFTAEFYNITQPLQIADKRLFRSCDGCYYYLQPDFGNIKAIAASIRQKREILRAEREETREKERIQAEKKEEEKRERNIKAGARYY